MVKLYDEGIYLVNGTEIVLESEAAKVQALTGKAANKEEAKKGTMACSILSAHNTSGDMEHLKLKFDAMASHDITFVGIVQTAKASGMEKFLPQLPVRRGGHHQRGRPCLRPVRREEVWRHLCSTSHCSYPSVHA